MRNSRGIMFTWAEDGQYELVLLKRSPWRISIVRSDGRLLRHFIVHCLCNPVNACRNEKNIRHHVTKPACDLWIFAFIYQICVHLWLRNIKIIIATSPQNTDCLIKSNTNPTIHLLRTFCSIGPAPCFPHMLLKYSSPKNIKTTTQKLFETSNHQHP